MTIISEQLVRLGMILSEQGHNVRQGRAKLPSAATDECFMSIQIMYDDLLKTMKKCRFLSAARPGTIDRTLKRTTLCYETFLYDLRYFVDALSGEEAEDWKRLVDKLALLGNEPLLTARMPA